MRRLLLISMAVLISSALYAANYYLPPTQNTLTDSALFAVYPNRSGARGMSWFELKRQTSIYAHTSSSWRISNATQIFNLMTTGTSNKLVKRAAPNAGTYDRVMEVKDKTGKIVYFIRQDGAMVFGTPLAMTINSIYPANGATNVSNGTWFNYSSTSGGWNYWLRINKPQPTITMNKTVEGSISNVYIQGRAISPTQYSNVWLFDNFSGTPGTTYTMKVNRGALGQPDGEYGTSCGSAMTDVSGICTSTFTMR